jgi:uncharacterized membrane protein
MWLIVTLLWLPWAGLAVWLARQLGLRRNVNEDNPSAEELVRRQYASGTIDRERFREIMADLSSGPGGSGGGASSGVIDE